MGNTDGFFFLSLDRGDSSASSVTSSSTGMHSVRSTGLLMAIPKYIYHAPAPNLQLNAFVCICFGLTISTNTRANQSLNMPMLEITNVDGRHNDTGLTRTSDK